MKNLERYQKDLERLIRTGHQLTLAMKYECDPDKFCESVKKQLGKEAEEYIENLPRFSKKYQTWYSESRTLVSQLLPERLGDFVDYYEVPKTRKALTVETYRISDYLLRLGASYALGKNIVGPSAAISKFEQQVFIVEAINARFESSLFEIRQLVQADLFDSDIEAARSLIKNGYHRAAGVIAGVVLEKHLAQVCSNHGIKLRKKSPTIADLNDKLKTERVIDIPQWRFNQHLGDLRNLCGHKKSTNPSAEQATDLVDGVAKVTKTLF